MSKNANKKQTNKDQRGDRNKKNQKGKSRPVIDRDADSQFRNDPTWYFEDEHLANQMSSFAFNQFVGSPFNLNSGALTEDEITIPSIMRIGFNPSIGFVPLEFARTSGINLAAFKLYTHLSSINAKTTNYAPQDLSTMILALGSLLALYGHIKRIFGTLFIANVRNRDIPKKLIEACGIDYADLTENLAAYRIKFNTILTATQRIPFPVNIPYFAKCEEMFSYYYTDDESAMAQIYLPAPDHVWQLNETLVDKGTALQGISVKNPTTMNALINIFESLAQSLMQSSTLTYVYADILNLASKQDIPLYRFAVIPEDYVSLPVYNKQMLYMFHNMRTFGDPTPIDEIPANVQDAYAFSDGLTIIPDPNTNVLWSNPVFADAGVLDYDVILDFGTDSPTQEEKIESTRYTGIGSFMSKVDKKYYHDQVTTGAWYPTYIAFVEGEAYSPMESITLNQASSKGLYPITKFKHHPLIYKYSSDDKFQGIIGALDYFTTVDGDYLNKLNDVCFLSLMSLR